MAKKTISTRLPLQPFGEDGTTLKCDHRNAARKSEQMTTNLLAFNTAATIYLVIGSLHEEARFREAFGVMYIAYQRSDVAFYLPSPDRSAAASMASVVNS